MPHTRGHVERTCWSGAGVPVDCTVLLAARPSSARETPPACWGPCDKSLPRRASLLSPREPGLQKVSRSHPSSVSALSFSGANPTQIAFQSSVFLRERPLGARRP